MTLVVNKGDRLTEAIAHLGELQLEPLKVYRPATQKQLRIHTSPCRELVIRGGKRSGKSICGFIEFASRVMGEKITANVIRPTWTHSDQDVELPIKYHPATKKDPRLYWVIGWDLKHIGQTVYRLLFEPGIFRVIRDTKTGKWRPYNPASDFSRKRESRASSPLIPPRMIEQDSWSWDHSAGGRAAHIFREVTLVNGAKICSYPSSAKAPKQGDPVDGLLIDEDIQQPEFLAEWQDRLTDRDGWFMWTVWPHMVNYALVQLIERAEEEQESEDRDIEAVQLLMSENPFIPKAARSRALKRMGDQESIDRRDKGELLLSSHQMYDWWPAIHNVGREDVIKDKPTTQRDVIAYLLNNGRMPEEWTRYVAIDPSHTRTGVVFGVVPPHEVFGVKMKCIIIEDEAVLKRASEDTVAKVIKDKLGPRIAEAFVMDKKMGQQTHIGSGGLNNFQKYSNAFKKILLASRLTKYSFIPGCPVPAARWACVRQMLNIGNEDAPNLYLISEKTTETQQEFKRYRKKQIIQAGETIIVDEPANPRKYDMMAALEYLCHYLDGCFQAGNAYVPAVTAPKQGAGLLKTARHIQQGLTSSSQVESYVHLGPGAAA